jgi:hypothetical protein
MLYPVNSYDHELQWDQYMEEPMFSPYSGKFSCLKYIIPIGCKNYLIWYKAGSVHRFQHVRSFTIFIMASISMSTSYYIGRNSAVGTATHYRMDGTGMDSQQGRDLPHLSIPALGPTQPPVQ